jgi:hypothetical protein
VADPDLHATVRVLVKEMSNKMFPGNTFASRKMECSSTVSHFSQRGVETALTFVFLREMLIEDSSFHRTKRLCGCS